MKNLIIFLFLFICLVSCGKEDPNDEEGQIQALKDGKVWTSSEVYFDIQKIENSQYSQGFYLGGNFKDDKGVVRKVLVFQTFSPTFDRQNKMEQWSIANFENKNVLKPYLLTVLDEGDVAGSTYGIDPLVNTNFIQITEIDTLNNLIYGIFDLSMVIIERSNSEPNIPESFHLKNGRFNAKLPLGWNKGVF